MPVKEALSVLGTILPTKIEKLIESQISFHSAKNKHCRRYSDETKSFALSLYHLSGKSYKMVSKLLCLPSKSSILKWVSRMPNCTSLTQPSIDVIATKVEAMSSTAKMCVISMDEMSLKSHLFYECSKDKVIGLEDLGDGINSDKLATSAIVLMARGLSMNHVAVKQPKRASHRCH